MKNTKKNGRSVILLLILAVVLMTVGFAAYAQNLTINSGTVNVTASSWDIRYVTTSLVEAGVTATTKSLTDTNFSFTVTLAEPGDYYEATFDAKNFGTIDAVLDQIEMLPVLTTAQQKYLSYTVTYNGTDYTASTATGLNVALDANTSKTVKVRVEYLQPTDSADLPSTDQQVTVSGTLHYIQK